MNHFGIGRLDESCGLYLPLDILKPLNITRGVSLFGISYPVSLRRLFESSRKKIKFLEENPPERQLDLVLSPIPYDFWKCSARLTIRTHHISGTFKAISSVLNRSNWTIVLSEASRSAHGYDTWSLIVSLDSDSDWAKKDQGFNKNEKIYKGFSEELINLEEQLKKQISEHLYEESNDAILSKPIEVTPHQSMAFFHHVSQPEVAKEIFREAKKDSMQLEYELGDLQPFQVALEEDGALRPHTQSDPLRSIIARYSSRSGEDLSNATVFTESQHPDMNLRAVVMSNERAAQYFGMRVSYEASSLPGEEKPSSRGLSEHYLEALREDFNVWGMRTKIFSSTTTLESGESMLVVQDKRRMRTNKQRQVHINKKISLSNAAGKKGVTDPQRELAERITKLECRCFPISRLFLPFEDVQEHLFPDEYDIFLSYSSLNLEEAKELEENLIQAGLKVFLDQQELELGGLFRDDLRDALKRSREMLVLCSPEAVKSDWVKREVGASWALNKQITPVVLHMRIGDLPTWLRDYQACYFNEMLKQGPAWRFVTDFKKRNYQEM